MSQAAEDAIVGCVLSYPDRALAEVRDLVAADFNHPQNATVWEAIKQLDQEGETIDPIMIDSWLTRSGQANAASWLRSLVVNAPIIETIGHYAKIVKQASGQRQLRLLGADIEGRAKKGDTVEETVTHARQGLTDIELRGTTQGAEGMVDIMGPTLETIEHRTQHPEQFGVHTGLINFENKIGALGAENLVTVGAAPGMGKTGLAVSFAHAAARAGVPSLFFSMEMSRQEIAERFLAREAHLDGRKIRQSNIDQNEWSRIITAASWLAKAPIWIDARPCKLSRLVAEIRRWHAKHVMTTERKIGLVLVDYLQLIEGDDPADKDYKVISDSGRRLKLTASELKIPIVQLSQLTREGRKGNEPPTLAALKGSGNIEADSDVVIFPWCNYTQAEDRNASGIRQLIIAKNRHGPVGSIECWWVAEEATFTNEAQTELPIGGVDG